MMEDSSLERVKRVAHRVAKRYFDPRTQHDMIEEVKSETCLRTLLHKPKKPIGFAYTVAERYCWQLIEERQKLFATTPDNISIPSRRPSPAQEIELSEETSEKLENIARLFLIANQALDTLIIDPRDRKIYQMYCQEGLSFTEIADRLGETVGNCRVRYWRLMTRVANQVRNEVRKDPVLSKAFKNIIENRSEFQRNLLGLLKLGVNLSKEVVVHLIASSLIH